MANVASQIDFIEFSIDDPVLLSRAIAKQEVALRRNNYEPEEVLLRMRALSNMKEEHKKMVDAETLSAERAASCIDEYAAIS